MLFNQIIGTDCFHSNKSAGNWLQVQLPVAKRLTSIALRTRYGYATTDQRGWTGYTLAWSNDWSSWTIVDTITETTYWYQNTEFQHDVDSLVPYLYYRMTFTQNSSYLFVSECTLLWY